MKKEIIDSFRKTFEELKQQYTNIQNQLKNDASKDIASLIEINKFDESQAAVNYLRMLLEEIKYDFDFSAVESSILSYNEKMEGLKSENSKELLNESKTEEVKEKTQIVSMTQALQGSVQTHQVSQIVKEEHKLDYLKNSFFKHGFKVVNFHNDESIELEKEKKHYYFTIVKSELSKEECINIFEEQNGKKNIGFVCEDEEQLVMLKEYANEWILTSPEYKTKFLTINYTTKPRLENKSGEVFDTASY